MRLYLQTLVISALFLFICSCSAQNDFPLILIKTNQGDIEIKLYNETPKHRDNFIKLVEEGFYDSLLFHRVIKEFMIQSGDPESKGAPSGKMLGGGGPGYKVPAEFVPTKFHKKGTLSAARQGDRVNPTKESSGSQFYIVQGKIVTDVELDMMEKKINTQRNSAGIRKYLSNDVNKTVRDTVIKYQRQRNGKALDSLALIIIDTLRTRGELEPEFKFTEKQRTIYKTVGGTPFLDTQYTVFGEVTKGLEIVDKIASVPTARGDRPVEDVIILEMKILKK